MVIEFEKFKMMDQNSSVNNASAERSNYVSPVNH